MKDNSLEVSIYKPLEFEIITWSDFENQMRRQNISEPIIFIIGDDNSEEYLAQRAILGNITLENDGVKDLDEHGLVEHQNINHLNTSMVLIEPELKYALIKALQFREKLLLYKVSFLKRTIHLMLISAQ